MKKIFLLIAFLSTLAFGNQKQIWLDNCFVNMIGALTTMQAFDNNIKFTADEVRFMCKDRLKYDLSNIATKKELTYDFYISYNKSKNHFTSIQIKDLKKHIEQDLLRYFSTPAFPKKIREAKKDEYPNFTFTIDTLEPLPKQYSGSIETNFIIEKMFRQNQLSIFTTSEKLDTIKDAITGHIKDYSQSFYEILNEIK